MCDHDPGCTEADDPVALALWRSDRPELVRVVCPDRGHRLAAVYAVPDVGPVLCCPPVKWLETPEAVQAHTHARLIPPGHSTEHEGILLRCRCGNFIVMNTDVDANRPDWRQHHTVDKHQRRVLVASVMRVGPWVGTDWDPLPGDPAPSKEGATYRRRDTPT